MKGKSESKTLDQNLRIVTQLVILFFQHNAMFWWCWINERAAFIAFNTHHQFRDPAPSATVWKSMRPREAKSDVHVLGDVTGRSTPTQPDERSQKSKWTMYTKLHSYYYYG
jgi:hypothetical protein